MKSIDLLRSFAVALALVLGLGLGTRAPAQDIEPLYVPAVETPPRPVPQSLKSADFSPSNVVLLPPLLADELKAMNLSADAIGVVRDLTADKEAVLIGRKARWESAEDGSQVATMLVQSESALGLRLHLRGETLPSGSEVIVYNPANADETWGPYQPAEILGASGCWTETFFADTVVVECRIPAEAAADGLRLRIASLLHNYRDAGEVFEKDDSCFVNVRCQSSTWYNLGTGVGRYTYIFGGTGYGCSGALLNDATSSKTPYFLTSSGCIRDAETADTIEVFWRYQTSACNGTAPPLSTLSRSRGSTLLATSDTARFTFLRLTIGPGVGTTFFGWTPLSPVVGDSFATIHHPLSGSPQHWAAGTIVSNSASMWSTVLSEGMVDATSRGAPMLRSDGKVIGVLSTIGANCNFVGGAVDFGRFNVIYATIAPWLTTTTPSRPPNDDYPGQTVSGRNGSVMGTTLGATPGENEGGQGFTASVWYNWTAEDIGPVVFQACPLSGGADIGLQVVLEDDRGNRSVVYTAAACDPTTRLRIDPAYIERGKRFYIQAFSTSGPGNGFTFNWNQPEACIAEMAPDDPIIVPWNGARGLQASVDIREGCGWIPSAGAQWITITDPISGAGPGLITFDVAVNPGGKRSATISTRDDAVVVVQLANPSSLPPNNDDFPGKTIEGVAGSVDGNTTNASREQCEPYHWPDSAAPTVWYNWVAPLSGVAQFNTCTLANFDTVVTVYRRNWDPQNTGPIADGACVQDDTHGDQGKFVQLRLMAASNDDTLCAPKSKASFIAVKDEVYYIVVTGTLERAGTFTMSWTSGGALPPEPPRANPPISITPTSFRAQWTGVSRADYYVIDVADNAAFNPMLTGYSNLNVGLSVSRLVTGLESEKRYYYRVRAVHLSGGASISSNIISLDTDARGEEGLSSTWYFAEGATVSTFQTFILMANPSDEERQVRMDLLFESMAPRTYDYTLAPNSRQTVELNSIAPPSGVSTVLTELNGKEFAAERAMYVRSPEDGRWNAAHAAVGLREPQPEWFFAEGATGIAGPAGRPFQTFILLANPTTDPLAVELTYYPEGAASFSERVTLQPKSRMTLEPGTRFAALASTSFSTRAVSLNGVGILGERAMWWSDPDWTATPFMGGHASPGLSRLSTQWYFAEGDTRGLDDFILFVNPSSSSAVVTVEYLLTDRAKQSRQFTLEPNSRRTLNVTYDAQGMGPGFRHATSIYSSQPIAVERSIYWSRGEFGWVDGTNALAAPQPSYKWLLPEGATVPITYGNLTTEILLANPSLAPAEVQVRFLLEGREPVTRTVTLGAERCMTLVANEIPELASSGFATDVSSNVPIVVERSMYFDTDRPHVINRVGGTCSMGLALESADPILTVPNTQP